jgi:hypothetical protein
MRVSQDNLTLMAIGIKDFFMSELCVDKSLFFVIVNIV